MVSRNRRITSAREVKRRANEVPSDPHELCAVTGCRRLTARAARKGLSHNYCRYHKSRFRLHGHATRTSLKDPQIVPYATAARHWISDNWKDNRVVASLRQLARLMDRAGKAESAYYAKGVRPPDKARIVLARLRDAGKTPERLLEAILSSVAAVREHGPRGYPRYGAIQTAKLAKRLRGASGTKITSALLGDSYKTPRAEGLYMVLLGEWLEEAASPAIDNLAIEEITSMVVTKRMARR